MPEPSIRPDDYKVARAQFIKSKRTEVRLRYALMADAEVARSVPEWGLEFDTMFRETVPQVLDLYSELRRLGSGAP
jgi:hypothetical protein